MKIIKISSLFFLILSFSACKKEDETLTGTNAVKIEFNALANGNPLVFGQEYTNEKSEKMTFSTFNYFISNISFVKNDGTIYTVPKDDSYFLIETGKTNSLTLPTIPAGDYKELRFMIGVDSLKSVSDISQRKGVLDPAEGAASMYWSWNSGYIFLKVEGNSPQSKETDGKFEYHIGLFGGLNSKTLNNLKWVSLKKDNLARVSATQSPTISLNAEIMELFKTPTAISVADFPAIHGSAKSKDIADNYADMFSVK